MDTILSGRSVKRPLEIPLEKKAKVEVQMEFTHIPTFEVCIHFCLRRSIATDKRRLKGKAKVRNQLCRPAIDLRGQSGRDLASTLLVTVPWS